MKRHGLIVGAIVLSACSQNDPGSITVTTWGEGYIENGIPADPTGEAGLIDGWAITFSKFLVTFHAVTIARTDGTVAATMAGSRLVDHVRPGRKTLATFPSVPAGAWDAVSFSIAPTLASTELVGATEDDRGAMLAGGFSVLVEGVARKDAALKAFRWGFPLSTSYTRCGEAEVAGRRTLGVVLPGGGAATVELTVHGDHPFYDRLRTSDVAPTRLRFEERATADTDGDGAVTLAELDATPLDVRTHDPSGFDAPNLGAFVRALMRTVGHFQGEGECVVRPLP